MNNESIEKRAKSSTKKYSVISWIIVLGVAIFLFILSFVVLGLDFNSLRTTSFWATFFILISASELVYKLISYVNKKKQQEENKGYISSNEQYNGLVTQAHTNYKRQNIDEWAKEVNKAEKYQAYRSYLEQEGMCLEDLKLNKKELKKKYNIPELEEKLDRKQIKLWKKCKLNRMPYEKINTNILLYDKDSFGNCNDKFGTDETAQKNEKKRDRRFLLTKIATSIMFVLIAIDTLKDINLESLIKFFMYLIAIGGSYATALINSSLFIKDRIIEFSKRSGTLLDFFRYAKERNIPKYDIYKDIMEFEKQEIVEEQEVVDNGTK